MAREDHGDPAAWDRFESIFRKSTQWVSSSVRPVVDAILDGCNLCHFYSTNELPVDLSPFSQEDIDQAKDILSYVGIKLKSNKTVFVGGGRWYIRVLEILLETDFITRPIYVGIAEISLVMEPMLEGKSSIDCPSSVPSSVIRRMVAAANRAAEEIGDDFYQAEFIEEQALIVPGKLTLGYQPPPWA